LQIIRTGQSGIWTGENLLTPESPAHFKNNQWSAEDKHPSAGETTRLSQIIH